MNAPVPVDSAEGVARLRFNRSDRLAKEASTAVARSRALMGEAFAATSQEHLEAEPIGFSACAAP